MARYYKYKTGDDLIRDADRLGHAIALSSDFSPLFQPVTFGGLTAANRLAIQPMEGCDGTLEGHPDELTFRRYVRFGAGGAGIIWGEATAVSDAGRMNPRQLLISEDTASGLEQMLETCRQARRDLYGTDDGMVVGLQLTHSGRYSCRRPLPVQHDPLLDPMTVDRSTGRVLDSSFPLLSDDDLKRLEDDYVRAALLAERIGCQFVDIKQCHKYLLSELLSSRQRPGPYGGSFENRTRFIRNVVGRMRAECPRLAIASRFNAYDGVPHRAEGEDRVGRPVSTSPPFESCFGTDQADGAQEDLAEPRQLARCLADLGVSLLNVSCGNPYANPHLVRPAEFPPIDGYHAPEHPLLGVLRHFRVASAIQAAVPEVPTVGSGYSWLQDYAMQAAAANVAAGSVMIAGLGRATLSQPDFARQLEQHGTLERKRVCRTFSYCTNLMRNKNHPLGQYPTGCPPFDKEAYGEIWREAEAVLKSDNT